MDIIFIDRDYSMTGEKQKRKILKEYAEKGKTVLFSQSLPKQGKIQIWVKK